jgi:beta-lactamase regulating signal transducer with metallopeptidase domain
MMATFGIQAIAQVSAVRIVDCLLEGMLIAAIAGFGAHLARRQSAGTRFALWFSALMAIAVSPFWSVLPRSARVAPVAGVARAAITLPGSWAVYLFSLWAVIAIFLLLRVGAGLWRLRVLRRTFILLDPARLDVRVRETLQRDSWTQNISLCVSERVQVPAAIGLVKPVVVLPTWLMDELPAEELNQVLLHELAHLRRKDDWTNLLQQVVKALFFFHPAVWWIERRISLEREIACDDAVLAETASPRSYAECLQHIAEKTLARRTLAMAQAALGRVRQISTRVAQILDGGRDRRAARVGSTGLAWAGFVIVCALVGANEPQFVAFNDVAPASASRIDNRAALANENEAYKNVALRPAALKTVDEAPPSPALRVRSPHMVVARQKLNATSKRRRMPGEATFVSFNENRQIEPVYLAYFIQEPAASQTAVFVLVQDTSFGRPGQPFYAIEIWHVTVLHPVVPSAGSDISRKQI